jgi:hypothetical protein
MGAKNDLCCFNRMPRLALEGDSCCVPHLSMVLMFQLNMNQNVSLYHISLSGQIKCASAMKIDLLLRASVETMIQNFECDFISHVFHEGVTLFSKSRSLTKVSVFYKKNRVFYHNLGVFSQEVGYFIHPCVIYQDGTN